MKIQSPPLPLLEQKHEANNPLTFRERHTIDSQITAEQYCIIFSPRYATLFVTYSAQVPTPPPVSALFKWNEQHHPPTMICDVIKLIRWFIVRHWLEMNLPLFAICRLEHFSHVQFIWSSHVYSPGCDTYFAFQFFTTLGTWSSCLTYFQYSSLSPRTISDLLLHLIFSWSCQRTWKKLDQRVTHIY